MLQGLLKIEYQEDLRQFRERVLETPLATRHKKGITWYPVEITEESVGISDHLVVEITRTTNLDKKHLFQVGSVAALFNESLNGKHGPPSVNGVISQVKENSLRLMFQEEELPDWAYQKGDKLGLDLYFDERTYREMEYALKKVIEAKGDRLAELREILLGSRTAAFVDRDEHLVYPDLNDSQNEAIRKVSQALDLAIIPGGP